MSFPRLTSPRTTSAANAHLQEPPTLKVAFVISDFSFSKSSHINIVVNLAHPENVERLDEEVGWSAQPQSRSLTVTTPQRMRGTKRSSSDNSMHYSRRIRSDSITVVSRHAISSHAQSILLIMGSNLTKRGPTAKRREYFLRKRYVSVSTFAKF